MFYQKVVQSRKKFKHGMYYAQHHGKSRFERQENTI